ncbi:MAG: hypothetical protein EBZ69_06795 [Alphaproteobacteria bacterium]|nr:hypothetical protein [Alphaproteobacteria bacterium]NDC56501.1 hypothetical protein [Alphaproteobacteria bacterium]NDG04433.1 hypothetical protein [Alphaproteobacteria bacterium]
MARPKLPRRRARLPRQLSALPARRRGSRARVTRSLAQRAGQRAQSVLRQQLLEAAGTGRDGSSRLLRLGLGTAFDAINNPSQMSSWGLDVLGRLTTLAVGQIVRGGEISQTQQNADLLRTLQRSQRWF